MKGERDGCEAFTRNSTQARQDPRVSPTASARTRQPSLVSPVRPMRHPPRVSPNASAVLVQHRATRVPHCTPDARQEGESAVVYGAGHLERQDDNEIRLGRQFLSQHPFIPTMLYGLFRV